jgi:GxxExxY protein
MNTDITGQSRRSRVLAAAPPLQERHTKLKISEHTLAFRGIQRGMAVATANGMGHLAHEELTRLIIQAFFQVWNELGHGYSEKIYRRALAMVLREMGLEAIEERHIKVFFHGKVIGTFWVDIVVAGKIVIEIKAPRSSSRATKRSCSTTSKPPAAAWACSSTSAARSPTGDS